MQAAKYFGPCCAGFCVALAYAPGVFAADRNQPALQPDPPVHDCDRLAGDPEDDMRVAPGTRVRDIDFNRAIDACRAAVAAHPGAARLQYHLGRVFHRVDDYTSAVEWYRKAAAQDYAPAMSILGVFYAAGGGVRRDYHRAVSWYRKAAARGHFIAMHNLAIRHTDGRGVPLDFNEAVRWFEKAAARGYGASMEGLGYIYLKGREGVAKDPTQAVHWLSLAAQKDRVDAMYFLALAYDKGEGAERDAARAAKWLHRAIKTGSRLALGYVAASNDKLSAKTRKAFQEALKRDGGFAGAADGVFGADTLAAAEQLARGGRR